MLQPAQIDQLTSGDGGRLRAIRLRALRNDPDAFGTTLDEAVRENLESWERQIQQLATFVATADGCDVGLVRGARHEHLSDTGYLLSMWVAGHARRQGIGSKLIDAVVSWAKTAGLNRLLLDVAESNAPAKALYSREGFVATGESGTLPPP